MEKKSKPTHTALGLENASLIASRDTELARQFLGQRFPLPGTTGLTFGTMAPHTAVIGSSGAGKTLVLKHLMASVLQAPPEQGGLAFRAVIYDPKRELYPFLHGLGISEHHIIVTNPFDARSASWNLAKDFVDDAQIEELAEMLVPTKNHQANSGGEFFESTSRVIFQEVIESLREVRPESWNLRDIIEAVSSPVRLKAVLRKTSSGRDIWRTYFRLTDNGGQDKTAQSILSSLMTYARPFRSLAALWQHAEREFTLESWHTGSGILLLGSDPSRNKVMQRLNLLLMKRVSQLVLGRNDERPTDLTWFFLDEVREAGKLDGLRRLMTEGRSKGARVVMGFQDIQGMYSVYGEHEAEEMVGLCANRLVMHLDTPKTRKWISEFFGDEEIVQPTRGKSQSHGRDTTNSDSTQWGIGLRGNVLPIELHQLPMGSLENGVDLFFAIPARRNFYHFSAELARAAARHETQSDAVTVESRPMTHQKMIRWDAADKADFGIKTKPRPELSKSGSPKSKGPRRRIEKTRTIKTGQL